MNPGITFVLNLAATWYLVGLIWLIQIVHYAMFDRVGLTEFAAYEADHNRLITPVVGIPMLIEIATAVALVADRPSGFPRWAAWIGLGMVLAIWLSTALLQVPCHARLSEGFDAATHRWLVASNWIRTGLWSARGLLIGWFAAAMLRT